MDARELNEWLAFERVYGPLTVQERVDFAGAEAAWAAARAGGAQSPLERFVPTWDEADQEPEVKPRQSPTELMAFMRSLQRKPKPRRKD